MKSKGREYINKCSLIDIDLVIKEAFFSLSSQFLLCSSGFICICHLSSKQISFCMVYQKEVHNFVFISTSNEQKVQRTYFVTLMFILNAITSYFSQNNNLPVFLYFCHCHRNYLILAKFIKSKKSFKICHYFRCDKKILKSYFIKLLPTIDYEMYTNFRDVYT